MFLYFIPNKNGAAGDADLRRLGLDYVVGATGPESVMVQAGPGGLSGQLLVPPWTPEVPAKFVADRQIWRKRADGAVWIGLQKDHGPAPQVLQRAQLHVGQTVRLADGNDWAIPRAVAFLEDRPMTLPAVIDLDDNDRPTARVHPRYQQFCEQAYAFFEHWSGRGEQLKQDQLLEIAVAALNVNYRIGRIEAVALLKLLDSESLSRLLRAVIDADALEQHVRASATSKKATPAGSASTDASSAPASPAVAG